MAQPPGAPGRGQKVPPRDDLYTLHLIVAAALLLIGIIYLAVRSTHLFGSLFPPGSGG